MSATPGGSIVFDRVVGEYERTRFLPSPIATRLARWIAAGVPADAWLLDAGSGTGRLGRALAERHQRTVGVDLSRGMLAEAQRLTSVPLHLAQGDITALPFGDETFAAVLSVHVLHLIPDWRRAVDELWRVVAPQGRLILGFEERTPTEVLERYLESAHRQGVLPPHPGAAASELSVCLESLGGGVRWHRPWQMSWQFDRPVAETLDALERRTYSRLWSVAPDAHESLLTATRRFASERFGDEDAAERHRVRLALLVATRP